MSIALSGTGTDNLAGLIRPRKTATPVLVNGDMTISQRATSTSSASTDLYFACDRWRTNISSYGAYTISQSTDVPTGYGFSKSFKIDCTTADASPASGDLFTFEQRIEGHNMQVWKKGTSLAETFTLAFWIKSNLTGNFTVNLVDSDNSRRIGALVTISSANTWEKKVLNFAKDTTGALADDNGDSFRVQFFLGVGSGFTSGTLPSAWESATTVNFAAGQTAFIGSSTDNELFITGLQLEVGTFSSTDLPDFQFEDRATSLARCQRYFQYFPSGSPGRWNSATQTEVGGNFPVPMRAVPTLSVNPNDNTCHIFRVGIHTNTVTVSSVASHLMGDTGGAAQINVSATESTPSAGDVSLYDTDGSDNVIFCDSEL